LPYVVFFNVLQRGEVMTYAHIYKAPKHLGKYRLIISTGCGISEGVISEEYFADMRTAKAKAKALNAVAWNY